MNIKRFAYCLCGPALLAGLLIISLLGGCRQAHDPQLIVADSKMVEHPDSAMMLLKEYRLPAGSSAADSAYYALLLTHARYKNFIDETDDSLISVSADYYLRHGDKERAARALFLQGMIRMNANSLGEAAVSFRKGLDIAREGKHYMWEGQCARGLYIIFGDMKNSSEQIKYAQTAYDAFMKGNNQDWSNFAKLNILRAYHNNGQYKNALKGAIELLNSAEERKDTALITESLVLIGSCRYSLADYLAALDCYLSAYSLDSTIIEQNHVYNIAVAATNINRDSISKDMEDFIEVMSNREGGLPLFKEMANNRRFEEAYHALEHYKNIQDSVIKIIMQNEVSEILDQYDTSKYLLEREKLKNERLSWGIIIILLVAIIVCSVWIYRKQQYNNEREREKLDATLDMLRTDLAQLMVRNDEMATQNRNINKKNALMSSYLRDFLKEKYRKADELCEAYFQDRIIQSKKAKYGKEIETILKDFSNQDFLQEAAKHINQCLDDLYSSFIEDFSNLKEDSRRLFMFLTLGLSTRTICVIFDIETSVFYNRKARLKKMVVESNAKRKEDYLKIITG